MSTLLELRDTTARICMDWRKMEASSAGQPDTFIDARNALDADHYYRGCYGIVVSGTAGNIGRRFRVFDSQRSNQTLTLLPALPFSTQVGDIIHLYNIASQGWSIFHYDATINDVIRGLGPAARVVHNETLPISWDSHGNGQVVPATFTHMYDVQYLGTNGKWESIPMAAGFNPYEEGWAFDDATKTVLIHGYLGELVHGYQIRILGYKKFTPLVNDSDTIDIDEEYLIHEAAYRIMIGSDDQVRLNRAGMVKNVAEQAKAKVSAIGPSNTIQLR